MSTDTERNLSERQKEERIAQAEFEQYAKEHGYIISTTNIIEQIRAEIQHLADLELLNMKLVLQIIDKYKGE